MYSNLFHSLNVTTIEGETIADLFFMLIFFQISQMLLS